MSRSWLEQKERSRPIVIRWFAKLCLAIGYRWAQYLTRAVTVYFFITNGRARQASAAYLKRVSGAPVTWVMLLRHQLRFAETLVDRLYLLAGVNAERFSLAVQGVEALAEALDAGRGCLLVGSHLGSFEPLRLLAAERGLRVGVLMFEEDRAAFGPLLRALNPALAGEIITIGQPGSLLAVKERLAAGEAVALLADRVFDDRRALRAPFLGSMAGFPTGPWRLARTLGVPVVLFFSVADGKGRYRSCFERMPESLAGNPGSQGGENVRLCLEYYVRRLEAHVRTGPLCWFNFYDFFGDRESHGG